jgi:hypothetical protein
MVVDAIPISDLKRSKVDATFQFGLSSKPNIRSKVFQGVLHLFEHNYNPTTKFWYGAAEVDCPYEALQDIQQQGMGWDFMIVVGLEDGRGGLAAMKNGEFHGAGDGIYTLITLVGLSTLTVENGVPCEPLRK